MIPTFLRINTPDGGGAIWLGVLLAFIVFGDFTKWWSRRNLALGALLVTTPLLNDIQYWAEYSVGFIKLVFAILFLVTLGHTVWGFALARPAGRPAWAPNLPVRVLKGILAVVVSLNALFVLSHTPEDAGRYTNLGTQRWMETGLIPYADEKLVGPNSPGGGAASTYGPLLYIAHMPLQIAAGRPTNTPGADIMDRKAYLRPSDLVTQLVCLAFYLGGLAGLFLVLKRLAGDASALGGVILYAAHPIIWGLDSGHGSIGGLTYVSHIAPSSMLLLALAAAGRPALSGALFAAAAGLLYYPGFMFPAWLGWRLWRKDHPIRFTVSYLIGAAVILGILDAFTPGGPREAIGAFMNAAFGHQEGTGPRQYGATPFGFWGTQPALASFWHAPLIGGSEFTQPIFLVFLGLSVLGFFWMRTGGTVAKLAAVSAALGAAVQLWKSHGVGTYIEWYLPLLMLALVAGDSTGAPATASAAVSADSRVADEQPVAA